MFERMFLAAALALSATPAVALQPSEVPDYVIPGEAEAEEPDLPDDFLPAPDPEPGVGTVALPASDTLPEPVRKLIATAIASNDQASLAAILKVARKAYPGFTGALAAATAEHEAQVAAKKQADERVRLARLRNPNPLANWKGEIELGASRSTGNTRTLALYAAGKGEREGLNWRHVLVGRADFQRTLGVTTAERFVGSWQPNYKFDDRLYAYGLGQLERDRFLGYDNRYTLGGGVGYGFVRRENMTLNFEGGPALRHTDFVDDRAQRVIAGRASVKFRWTLSPNLQFGQDAAIYLEPNDNNAVATTTLDTRLIGALKARFSYNVQYERDPPNGRQSLDTLSRATIVYSF